MMRCEVCDEDMRPGLANWHFICPKCRLEASTLEPHITRGRQAHCLDEEARQAGLAPIRRLGRSRLIAALRELRGAGGRRGSLLEVGSAHGWFLEEAVPLFERVLGIEPDEDVRRAPNHRDIKVRAGLFPNAIAENEQFDVVVFNDVFEHIPSAPMVAQAAHRMLNAGGMCVVNLPMAAGTLYWTSKLLFRVGITGPFERMWQKGFPSPHLYYFSRRALFAIFRRAGFVPEREVAMPALSIPGLWSRIICGERRFLFAFAYYIAGIVSVPILLIFPRDVKCFFMRKML